MALCLFQNFLPEENILSLTLDDDNNKSSIGEILSKIGTKYRQLDLYTIYRLAALAIPNVDLREKVRKDIVKHKNALANISWPCLVQPLVNLAFLYGLLRKATASTNFITYVLSYLSILPKLSQIQFIALPQTRATITHKFVQNCVGGNMPHLAFSKAFGKRELEDVCLYPSMQNGSVKNPQSDNVKKMLKAYSNKNSGRCLHCNTFLSKKARATHNC